MNDDDQFFYPLRELSPREVRTNLRPAMIGVISLTLPTGCKVLFGFGRWIYPDQVPESLLR
jgi:hypothetical protein